MKQLAFFMNPSRLSWKIISWLSDQIFNAIKSPYFHGLWHFYLIPIRLLLLCWLMLNHAQNATSMKTMALCCLNKLVALGSCKLLIKRVLANGWTHPSSMIIFELTHTKCHMKSYHSDIKYHLTLNIIFSVVGLWFGLDLVSNHVVLVLGNEGGGPHHIEGHHTLGLWIGLRKSLGFGFEYSSNIQLRLKRCFLSLYLKLAQMLIWICMCNSLKYPLP